MVVVTVLVKTVVVVGTILGSISIIMLPGKNRPADKVVVVTAVGVTGEICKNEEQNGVAELKASTFFTTALIAAQYLGVMMASGLAVTSARWQSTVAQDTKRTMMGNP
jgi:hypothetical protein